MFKNMIRSALGGVAALVLAAVLLGTSGVTAALWDRVQFTTPLTITLLRTAFAIPFLLLVSGTSRQTIRPFLPHSARLRWLITALGCAFAGSQSLFFIAIPLAGVTLVVIISLCSTVLFVALLSIPMFRERLNGRGIVAVVLAIAGTITLALAGQSGATGQDSLDLTLTHSQNYIWGLLAALGSGVCLAAYMLLAKIAAQRNEIPHTRLLIWAFVVALTLLTPLAALTGGIHFQLTPQAWVLALYMGMVATGLAYWLMQVGLHSSSATVASVVTLLEPAVAGLLAWLVLGESISALHLVGAAMMLGSVVLLACTPAKPQTSQAENDLHVT